MGSDLIELTSEVFDQDPRIDPVLKPLHAQAFIPELAVEGFVHPIQPGLSWVDVRSVDADRLAVLVIDQKWPKDVFVRRGPGQVVDLGDLWSVRYENALGNANDPVPTSGGKVVPKTLTIRIRKVNGEIVAISS